MRIAPVGDWEHSAYQSDSQFVIEVRQKKVDVSKLTQGPGYSGEKLSLNFQNIEVRSLLQVIADFTNFNIVTSDTVSGALTLRLKDVPGTRRCRSSWMPRAWACASRARCSGLRPRMKSMRAPSVTMKPRWKSRNWSRCARGFQLNYAKAADILLQITTNTSSAGAGGTATRFLSERGSAISEPRTNQLFVTDTPAKLEAMKALLATLDVPVRQVLIEARIVEARDTFGRALGVRLGGGTCVPSVVVMAATASAVTIVLSSVPGSITQMLLPVLEARSTLRAAS